MTWNEISSLQRTHKKADLVAQAVIGLARKWKTVALADALLSNFVVDSDFWDVRDEKSAHGSQEREDETSRE